jgi:hypothetical protein
MLPGQHGRVAPMTLNKYKNNIDDKLLDAYFDTLKGGFFKILPIFEGKDFDFTKEESYLNYKKYVQNLIYEVNGAYFMYGKSIYLLKLMHVLEGMLNIQQDKHDEVRSLVLGNIHLINKIKGDVKKCH